MGTSVSTKVDNKIEVYDVLVERVRNKSTGKKYRIQLGNIKPLKIEVV